MKNIKITPEQKQAILEKFSTMLDSGRFSDGRINFNEPMEKVMADAVQKPIVIFSPVAWLKLTGLVEECNQEIGWHGTVEHKPGSPVYFISDILVYPQKVSGTTVTTDDKTYSEWLMKLDDDTFNKVRFQGHSHVRMTVSPSGVDQNFYDSILQTLQEGDYYIFMITNKSGDVNIWVYDFAQNIIFEKTDVNVMIKCGKDDLDKWIHTEMKEKVETVSYITPSKYVETTPGRNIDAYPGSMYGRAAEGIHINDCIDDDYMLHKIYAEAYGENTKSGKGKRGGKR